MAARFLTIALIIAALIGYQVAQRAMPPGANPFAVVIIVYLLGIAACIVLAPVVGRPIGLYDAALVKQWPLWALAGSVVGSEVGFLLAYRAGWPLATATGITYTASMAALAVIGTTFFAEDVSPRRVAGLALAIAGVWLLVAAPRAP
jgi:drug/metabolite transporter (DMT)-like permease